jgi:hypothetical protein
VRHRPRRIGDHPSVSRVGLGRTRVQVGDPTHRQARQVGHRDALVQRDRDRQRADGGRLVDDQQHRPMGLHAAVELAELGLVVGQRTVQQFLTGPVLRDGVVPALADVQPEEHGDLVMPVDHEHLRPLPARRSG